MKIISKYKDYYDFYSGIYGIDDKLVLDRRDGFIPYIYLEMDQIITLHILDNMYMGYSPKGTTKVFYGEELKKFDKKSYCDFWNKNKEYVYIGERIYITPQKSDKNIEKGCPILIETRGFKEYPRLSELCFHNVIDPFTMWRMLGDWLSIRINEKENVVLDMSDSDKALTKGIDPKTAFRPKMK